jgi:ABC-type Fe3+-hydroxamate transport system substrate-binding protein
MHDDTTTTEAPTRRDVVKLGGTAAGGGLLAGCTGDGGGDGTGGDTPTDDPTPTDDSYTATLAPAGEVEFEAVPETVYTGLPNTADMAVAAGQADAIEAVYYPSYHGSLLDTFYDRLDGVSVDWDGLTDSWNLGVEGFYELDSDIHLTDPAYATTLSNLDGDTVSEIGEQVGPWFGNYYSNRRIDPPEGWKDDYQYYDLWEINQRVANAFRAGERASALREIHEEMLATVESNLPPAEERPSATLVFPGEEETFYVYQLNVDGFLSAHTRPLQATDVFGDTSFEGPSTQVDYEAMVEADPDAMLVLFTTASSYSIADIRSRLAEDDVASEIAAVQDDRVYAQGARYQGPIMNLFQTEMTAKQLYPEQFGAWPGYVDGEPYPEIPESEQLFDRQEVADIINGAI